MFARHRTAFLAATLLALILFTGGCNRPPSSGWRTLVNRDIGFQFSYPSGWSEYRASAKAVPGYPYGTRLKHKNGTLIVLEAWEVSLDSTIAGRKAASWKEHRFTMNSGTSVVQYAMPERQGDPPRIEAYFEHGAYDMVATMDISKEGGGNSQQMLEEFEAIVKTFRSRK